MINFKSSYFVTRLISSIVMLPLMFFVWNGGWALISLICVFVFGMFYESLSMLILKNNKIKVNFHIIFLSLLGSSPLLLFLLNKQEFFFYILFYLVFFSILSIYFRLNLFSLFFILLIIFSGLAAILIADINSKIIFYLFILVFISDTSAYIFGNYLQGPKIFPNISPNKTWSGSISAILLSMIAALFFIKTENFFISAFIGTLTSILAQNGDLLESYYKRNYGYKDSGKIIPGHGGVLDRLDSLLINLPFYYILIYFDLFNLL